MSNIEAAASEINDTLGEMGVEATPSEITVDWEGHDDNTMAQTLNDANLILLRYGVGSLNVIEVIGAVTGGPVVPGRWLSPSKVAVRFDLI